MSKKTYADLREKLESLPGFGKRNEKFKEEVEKVVAEILNLNESIDIGTAYYFATSIVLSGNGK